MTTRHRKKLEPRDPKIRKLLQEFDDWAQSHGYQKNEGSGPGVDAAAEEYLRTRNALVRRLNGPRTVQVLMTETLPGEGCYCYYEDYELDPEANELDPEAK